MLQTRTAWWTSYRESLLEVRTLPVFAMAGQFSVRSFPCRFIGNLDGGKLLC